jgi:hypothetical protein
MILLAEGNRILKETVSSIICMDEEDAQKDKDGNTKHNPMDVTLCDFDDVSYHVAIDKDDTNKMLVEMSLPVYHSIADKGGDDDFKEVFGDIARETSSANYHVAVEVDLTKLPEKEEEREALCAKLSKMKPCVVGGAFNRYYKPLGAGDGTSGGLKPEKYDIRQDTTVYFVPQKDRCVTIFAFNFTEEVDRVVAAVFMQEFQNQAKKSEKCAPNEVERGPPEGTHRELRH